eukprot:scaffold43495_cov176-Amphora_coffeaeformis.AAC.1
MEVIQLVFWGIAIQHIRSVGIMKDTCGHFTTFVYLLSMSILFLIIHIANKRWIWQSTLTVDRRPSPRPSGKSNSNFAACHGTRRP